MTVQVNDAYIEKFWNRAPLSVVVQKEFFSLSYDQAVSFVHQVASGKTDGSAIGLNRNVPLSFPGHEAPSDPSIRLARRKQKLLIDRRMQAHVISHFGSMSVEELMEQVEFQGLSRLEEARCLGKNVCLINSHVGSAMLVPILMARIGHHLSHMGTMDIAANFNLEGLGRIDQISMRGTFAAQLLAAGLRGLRTHGMLHLTGDGLQGVSGTAQPFLDKLRKFPQGPAYIGLTAQAIMMPVFTRLSPEGKLRLTFHKPLQTLPASEPMAKRMDHLVAQYSKLLEEFWSADFGNVGAGLVGRHMALPDAPRKAATEA